MTKDKALNYVVVVGESGMKLQAFLKSKLGPTVSAKQIKHAVDAGNCQTNGKVERFSSRIVGTGDRITFYKPEVSARKLTLSALTPYNSPDRMLYMDNELIIYDKPSGFSSEDPRLLSFVKQCDLSTTETLQKKARLIPEGSIGSSVQLVHRLDRDTTGVLVFARNLAVAEAMFALFK
ncbi:MAG: hypothetical protein H0X29_04685, partial [Parachlamydiaceae bacterium]|nr:hypothetical protein [Parachlamydiaceae bacterium]